MKRLENIIKTDYYSYEDLDYKKFKIDLGSSDIATLKLEIINDKGNKILDKIETGADGDYKGYVIDNTIDIPSHYIHYKTFKFIENLKIYDDNELVLELDLRNDTFFKYSVEIYTRGYTYLFRIVEPCII